MSFLQITGFRDALASSSPCCLCQGLLQILKGHLVPGQVSATFEKLYAEDSIELFDLSKDCEICTLIYKKRSESRLFAPHSALKVIWKFRFIREHLRNLWISYRIPGHDRGFPLVERVVFYTEGIHGLYIRVLLLTLTTLSYHFLAGPSPGLCRTTKKVRQSLVLVVPWCC